MNEYIDSIADQINSLVDTGSSEAKILAERYLDKGQDLLVEYGDSANFAELSRNLAAQAANDAAQLGISLNSEARATLRGILATAISALKFVVVS